MPCVPIYLPALSGHIPTRRFHAGGIGDCPLPNGARAFGSGLRWGVNVPFDLLQHSTYRITHDEKGINRVLYDLTPKPTGTIEWE